MLDTDVIIPEIPARKFLPDGYRITDWPDLEKYYKLLLEREISTPGDLRKWLQDRSELDSIVAEDLGWRYIRMTSDTANDTYLKEFQYFINEIEPRISPYSNLLNKKVFSSVFFKELNDPGFKIIYRNLEKDLKIFREVNIPIFTEIQTKAQIYTAISAAMTIETDGTELTLQQAGDYLFQNDRGKREEIYKAIAKRRLQDSEKLDNLFSELISLRTRVAGNAGFVNYRDYMFTAMGRFDYTPEDCFQFHRSVEKQVLPLLNEFAKNRENRLRVDRLKPWDHKVDIAGRKPLKPFSSEAELLDKTITAFFNIDPYFGNCLGIMKKIGHLDLVSRKGKAPGGYNYPLPERGIPFIFMNATSNLRDLVTLLHEGGHAVHSFLTKDLELNDFKNFPSEIAELASMSMELISMDQWHLFFNDEDDLKRAKQEQLHQVIDTLAWVAAIDSFQHWVYENPEHSQEERKQAWERIYGSFSDNVTDWNGVHRYRSYLWQKQLHLYEVPFYYIEYGIAQLGAIALWKLYKSDKEKGLKGYKNALSLGYTQPLKEVYKAAGIEFNFSEEYIRELFVFIKMEIDNLQ
jgi:oligoendopeptidase F